MDNLHQALPHVKTPSPSYRGKLLLEESPVLVIPGLACLIGLNESLVIQQIHFWTINPIEHRELRFRIELREKDGHIQVRIAHRLFMDKEHGKLRFLSLSTFKRAVARCKTIGILDTEPGEEPGDTMNWYTIHYEKLFQLESSGGLNPPTGQNEPPRGQNDLGGGQNEPSQGSEWTEPGFKMNPPYKDIERIDIDEPASADALAGRLISHGIAPEVADSHARDHPANVRHALAYVAENAKWFGERSNKAGALVRIIQNPERYQLKTVAPPDPSLVAAVPEFYRENLRAWLAAKDPVIVAFAEEWELMSEEEQAERLARIETGTNPFSVLME